VKSKLVCQWRQVCWNCSYLVTYDSKLECFKKFCTFCNKKQPSGHLCYVAQLKPSKLSNKCLYVYFDTECTQDLEKRDGVLSMFQTSYVLSRCVKNLKPWKMFMSIAVWKACSLVLARPRRQIYRLSPVV